MKQIFAELKECTLGWYGRTARASIIKGDNMYYCLINAGKVQWIEDAPYVRTGQVELPHMNCFICEIMLIIYLRRISCICAYLVAHRNHRTHRIANRSALAPSGWKAHANYFLTSRKGAKIRKVYSSHRSTFIVQLSTLIVHRSTFNVHLSTFTSELQNLRTRHLL